MNEITLDDFTVSSAIERLKAKGVEFAQAYSVLLADYEIAKTDPALLAEWQSLKDTADKVKGVITWINSQVDSAANWLSETFGFSGLRAVGAIPLIPIAYVTGAITALVYVVSKIWEFHAKAELVRQNLAPGSILDPSASPIGETANLLKWVIIGAALYFAAPPLLKRLGVKL